MTIEEAVVARHSVRNYMDKKIEAEKISSLKELIDQCNKEGRLHLQFIEDAGNTFNRLLNKAMGLGSAPSIIACVGEDDETLDERVGYWGEKVVLLAQQLGLNTCWAGTYNKKNVNCSIENGERLAIVIAIGYGANQGRPRKSKTAEQVIEGNREALPEWFNAGVEMALMAPTAINQQKFTFEYADGEVKLSDKGGVLSKIDQGIVRCHFEIGSKRTIKMN